MNRMKKNIKRIWGSKCKYLVIVACALILANGVNFLQTSLKFINSGEDKIDEIKSVEIVSDTWDSDEQGSWKVVKSADWTGEKEATITFNINTRSKTSGNPLDVVFVLDISGSMYGSKLERLQQDATELVEFLLSNDKNRVAIITFANDATIQSSFTNDKGKAINVINSLSAYGMTNYTSALEQVLKLLSNNFNANRELSIVFLTDGLPTDSGKGVAQYTILKSKYPFSIMSGIQYEMGTDIIPAITNISDIQYHASQSNLKEVLFEASLSGVSENYETFEIVDYITDDFYVNSVNDIKVSEGSVKLENQENGKQKVIWTLANTDKRFITGSKATMEITAIFKGINANSHVYPTNEKEEIKTKLWDENEKKIISELTPKLQAGYQVIYNPNLPIDCNQKGENIINTHFGYEIVDKFYGNYTCNGWQIQEWKVDDDITLESNDKFIMPTHDVNVTAIWTKVDISKKMDGVVAGLPKQELLMAMKENAGASVSVDTSINFSALSSASNGRGLYIRSGTENDVNPIYYYRGNVTNNNVLFAGMCWQIVRTTETGGIKLIYNGISSDGVSCENAGNPYIGESKWNEKASPSSVGYMYDSNDDIFDKKAQDRDYLNNYYFGNDIVYDVTTGNYTLVSPKKYINKKQNDLYSCFSTSDTCSTVYFEYYTYGGTTSKVLKLSGGETLEDVIHKMFKNTNNSDIKDVIDSWYKMNIDDKGYTKYLEDVVWCNDRTIVSGPLATKNNSDSNNFSFYSRKQSASVFIKDADACPNVNDRFTVSKGIGNGNLTYPVGMITGDELKLAGFIYSTSTVPSQDSYLSVSYYDWYWTMTPFSLDYIVYGNISKYSALGVIALLKIRPSISLKPGTMVQMDGAGGTKANPYVIVE